jgi:hypothetical protein
VSPPSLAKPPKLTVGGPLFVGHCDPITIDIVSGALVNGGNLLTNLTITVESEQATTTSLKSIQSFLYET